MLNNTFISFCGDVCSECPRYIATQTNNNAELDRLAELWFRLGFRDKIVASEEMECNGCSRDKFCSHNINNCEHLLGKNNCGECQLFTCEKIEKVFAKTDATNAICKTKCSEAEYNSLARAFLMKREVLTDVNTSTFS